jgi:hypothetical protein
MPSFFALLSALATVAMVAYPVLQQAAQIVA